MISYVSPLLPIVMMVIILGRYCLGYRQMNRRIEMGELVPVLGVPYRDNNPSRRIYLAIPIQIKIRMKPYLRWRNKLTIRKKLKN